MASQHSRGDLNPASLADHIAPTSGSMARPYTTNMRATQHTSVHSHMSRPSLHMPSMNPNAGHAGYTREAKVTAEDNREARFELFLLGEGEKKVTEEADTRKLSSLFLCRAETVFCFSLNFSITKRSLLQWIPIPVSSQTSNPITTPFSPRNRSLC